ncbi:MAG: DUF4404 family protein [Gemmatimonadota bacterium]
MSNEELRTRLTALHQELDGIEAVDPETRGLLQQLAIDIRPIIEPSAQTGDYAQPATIKERLAQTITAVEGSHPRLAKTLTDLVDTMVFYNL